MANREERSGGATAPPPRAPVSPQKPSSVLQGNRPGATRRRTTNTNYSNNQGQNRSRAINRRSGGGSKTPSSPGRPDSKIIVPPSPPKPVAPDLKKFLAGDSTYQRQVAAFAKSLADFQADQGIDKSDYMTNYTNTQRDIGLAKGDASKHLEDDYASRGLLKSGLYNTALGELNQQYQNQFGDLDKQKLGYLSGLGQELTKYNNGLGVQKGNAYNEAVRRRAEQYNL